MRQNPYRLQLTAPRYGVMENPRAMTTTDGYEHHRNSLQELRGFIYLRDGAIQPWQLDAFAAVA